tara:strand:- start:65569 stop:66015 length:447 start_codon:yes stop_codon:yes gene_type:complete
MKILMVCLGNICRSPLAEGILKNKAKNLDLIIDSAGTANYHVGKNPDIRSIEIAEKHGVDIKNQIARQFTKNDFINFDVIYAMDKQNYYDIIRKASSKLEIEKVKLILSESNNNFDCVPDPYYGGKNGFHDVYNMLDEACEKIITNIA